MPHIVNDNCRHCLFTDCVEHCPVQCFHADGERTYIDPDVCIDCSACVPACPVQAISEVVDYTDEEEQLIELNRNFAQRLPIISRKRSPLPSADARRAALGFA
jgi:ferredoxin